MESVTWNRREVTRLYSLYKDIIGDAKTSAGLNHLKFLETGESRAKCGAARKCVSVGTVVETTFLCTSLILHFLLLLLCLVTPAGFSKNCRLP